MPNVIETLVVSDIIFVTQLLSSLQAFALEKGRVMLTWSTAWWPQWELWVTPLWWWPLCMTVRWVVSSSNIVWWNFITSFIEPLFIHFCLRVCECHLLLGVYTVLFLSAPSGGEYSRGINRKSWPDRGLHPDTQPSYKNKLPALQT